MEAFLNSFTKKNTRRLYKRGLEKFVDWYGKTVDEILARMVYVFRCHFCGSSKHILKKVDP